MSQRETSPIGQKVSQKETSLIGQKMSPKKTSLIGQKNNQCDTFQKSQSCFISAGNGQTKVVGA